MTITPAAAPRLKTQIRLLPAESQLRDGNAAVVLLRMIWEQQNFMQKVAPQIPDLLKLPYDDPTIPPSIAFDGFRRQLGRAAYMRDAEWNYPFDEEPHANILLPDVQGMRLFLARGMKLWVGSKIAQGDLDAAREGMLVQIAGARHLARTPIMVNHLVAGAIADAAFDRGEILVSQPDCPNLYWALAMLPDTLGNVQECLDWEANVLPNTLMKLSNPPPPVGDPVWKEIANEFAGQLNLIISGPGQFDIDAGQLLANTEPVARTGLVDWGLFDQPAVDSMSQHEAIMRWVLHLSESFNAEIIAAFTLPPAKAIESLVELGDRISNVMQETGTPAVPFAENPVGLYLGFYRFDRRVKMLQTVEAIRHHLATHQRQLPASLDEIDDLHLPHDPLTDQPFKYEVVDGIAYLSTPEIPRIGRKRNQSLRREYLIELAID